MQIFCVFCNNTFDSFKTTIAISNSKIYGASKTVRLAKRNIEKVLNGPETRQLEQQVKESEFPISCILCHKELLILFIVT